MLMLKNIVKIILFFVLLPNNLFAQDIPVIVISPGKTVQSLNTVGSSVEVFNSDTINNSSQCVKNGGQFYLSIYNDQGGKSKRILIIKKLYNAFPNGLKWIIWMPMLIKLWWRNTVRDLIQEGKLFSTWRNYAQVEARGMSAFTDVIDWVGGLPFEVAKPEEIFDFFVQRGFKLKKLKTCGGGIGCNEFVFKKSS